MPRWAFRNSRIALNCKTLHKFTDSARICTIPSDSTPELLQYAYQYAVMVFWSLKLNVPGTPSGHHEFWTKCKHKWLQSLPNKHNNTRILYRKEDDGHKTLMSWKELDSTGLKECTRHCPWIIIVRFSGWFPLIRGTPVLSAGCCTIRHLALAVIWGGHPWAMMRGLDIHRLLISWGW